jgi:hypothetical protein
MLIIVDHFLIGQYDYFTHFKEKRIYRIENIKLIKKKIYFQENIILFLDFSDIYRLNNFC